MNAMLMERDRAMMRRGPDGAALDGAALTMLVARALPLRRVDVIVDAQLPSTNAQLLAQARQQQPVQPMVLAADHQTAGRGRQGRRWHARPGNALLFSLAAPLAHLPPALPAVTLAGGVALARALHAQGVDVQLKWPNDLLLDGRKLGGLLFELATDAAGRATLVAGVGINVRLSDEERAVVGQPVAALADVVAVDDGRETRIAALAAALLQAIDAFVGSGFAPWREPYNALLAGRGQPADIVDDGRVIARGRIVGVDDAGQLVLQAGAGRVAVNVGDVSLRLTAPDTAR